MTFPAIGIKTKIVLAVALLVFGFLNTDWAFGQDKQKSPCAGRQWLNSKEELECRFPNPPIGRWHAVYTAEFAKVHSLPPENISTDLSPGVDYMEMDVQPYGNGATACLVNILIKQPNDVAAYNKTKTYSWAAELHARRKLTHFLDLDRHKDRLRQISTFGVASRNKEYDPNQSYSIGGSFAFYAADIIENYDYITANASCYHVISSKEMFPDRWAFSFPRASIWGRNEPRFKSMDEKGRPQGEEFFNSLSSINIPKEIIMNVFKDMPIGGQ